MRNPKQVKVISSQLEVLDELKQQLDSLTSHIVMLMEKGKSWIEETENLTYNEINKFLALEAGECLRQCDSLAGNQDEVNDSGKVLPPLHKTVKGTDGNMVDMSKYLEKIDKLEQKQKEQKKQIQILAKQKEDSDSKYDVKFEEIMEEFHAASNFMTSLQTQWGNMNKEIKEINKQTQEMFDGYDSLVNLKLKQTDQEEKLNEVCRTQVELEKSLTSKFEESVNSQQLINERLDAINTQHTKFLDEGKVNEDKIDKVSALLKLYETMQQKHKEWIDLISKKLESLEERSLKNLNDIEIKVQGLSDLTVSLPVQSKTLSSEIEELKKSFYETSLDIKAQKKHSSDISKEISALKVSIDKYKGKKHTFQELYQTVDSSRDLVISLEDESKTLSSEIDELKKSFRETSLDIKAQKKHSSDISNEIFALKTVTSKCTDNQKLMIQSLEKSSNSAKMKTDVLLRYDIAKLSTKVDDILAKEICVGFCADLEFEAWFSELKKDQILNCFNYPVNLNESISTSYNRKTGIFTAPCDGLYLVGLAVENLGAGNFKLNICQRDKRGNVNLISTFKVCKQEALQNVIVPVTISKGDQLYIKSGHDYVNVNMGLCSNFMCVLINANVINMLPQSGNKKESLK